MPLLIIDDFGVRKLPHTAADDLLEIIVRRYDRFSTLLTSNRPVEDWGKPFLWLMGQSYKAKDAVPLSMQSDPTRTTGAQAAAVDPSDFQLIYWAFMEANWYGGCGQGALPWRLLPKILGRESGRASGNGDC